MQTEASWFLPRFVSRDISFSETNQSQKKKMLRASIRRLSAGSGNHCALQSEKAQPHWSMKVIRKAAPTKFFAHPSYVMAREKILSKLWREQVLFGANVWFSLAFFGAALSIKA